MSFTNPKENLSSLNLDDGNTVADLGSGTGGYALVAAEMVGDGKVYAIEIQKNLLERLQNEAEERGLSNIEIIWGDLEKIGGSTLADNLVDVVLVTNTLFLVQDKKTFLLEARRILKPNGRVLVVDWISSFQGLGPQPEQVIPEMEAQKLFKDNGFQIEKSLLNAGDHHYGFIARKASNE